MPPKKKVGKKKKKKDTSSNKTSNNDGLGLALVEDRIEQLKSQNDALQIQAAHRAEIAALASQDSCRMKEKLMEAESRYDEALRETEDLTLDMTRQYKGMQDDLLNKINERERYIESLKDEIEAIQKEHSSELKRHEDVLQRKDILIDEWKKKTEELTADFAGMLSNILSKLGERIDVHSSRSDKHSDYIRKKMEEFIL